MVVSINSHNVIDANLGPCLQMQPVHMDMLDIQCELKICQDPMIDGKERPLKAILVLENIQWLIVLCPSIDNNSVL